MQLDRLLVSLGEAVDADDHALARLDFLLPAERRLLDLLLHEALLDRGDGAAEVVDALDQLPRVRFELVRECLDEVRAPERVRRVGAAGLMGEQLLCPQRDVHRMLARQRERLVVAVRVDRLCAAADR